MNNRALILGISSLAFFLSYFLRLSWGIVSVYSTLKPTVYQNSLIFSLFFLGYVIVQIPAGIFSEKYNSARIVSLSLLGLAFSSILSGIANNINMEYFASFLMGFSGGWIYPNTIKLFSASFKDKKLPIAMSIYSLSWPLSIIIAGSFLPYISIETNWRIPYYIFGLIAFLTFLPSLFIIFKNNPQKINLKFYFNKNIIILSSGGFLFFASYWIITLYSYKYFILSGIDPILSGIIYSMMAVAGIPGTLLAGFIINRFGVKKVLVVYEFIYAFLALFLIFVNIYLIIIIALSMGFIRFTITPANSTILAQIGKENAGNFAGTVNFFWQSAGIFGPLLASYILTNFNYYDLWISVFIMTIISGLVYLNIKIKN